MTACYGCTKRLTLDEGYYFVNVPVPRQGRIEAKPLPMCAACNAYWRAMQVQQENKGAWKKPVTVALLVVMLTVTMCATWG